MRSGSAQRFLRSRTPAPLVRSLAVGHDDAYALFRRMAAPGRPAFVLESAGGLAATARYSFLATDPYLTLVATGDGHERRYRDGRVVSAIDHPWTALQTEIARSRRPADPELPPFTGGAITLLSYDLVRRFERLPTHAAADEPWPELCAAFVDLVAAVDHATGRVELVFAPPTDRWDGEPRDKLYREGCDRLAELAARLTAPVPTLTADPQRCTIVPEQARARYMERVRTCQAYIAAGDIYQANLSHRFRVETAAARIDAGLMHRWYGRLRARNASPFMALADFGAVGIVSSSPERLVRLRGRRADTRPIAGTRPRAGDASDDRRLVAELRASPKEQAEHIMLVDLERNDLGRVCRPGTVTVTDFMTVEQYSHVSHLVSNVAGDLRDDCDAFDLLSAVFPGGTITGVPKIRCMELIDELEPVRRGPYTGALGYISWSGDIDFNILIRTIAVNDGRAYLQAGAGIVADSEPSAEYDETLFKAAALMEAVEAEG